MNELLREIEDDIRREKFDRLWQRLGKILIGVSIAVVLATVAGVIVQNYRQSLAMEHTDQFMAGVNQLDSQNYKDAIATFTKLSSDDNSTYYGMAMLRKAQAQNASGDKEGAIKTYQSLAAHNGTFAKLAAMQTGGDKIIVPDRQTPFYYTLSEWKGWQLIHDGKKEEAAAQFVALRDDADAPPSLRQRMQEVVGPVKDDSTKEGQKQ